jgi:hypothetical protein
MQLVTGRFNVTVRTFVEWIDDDIPIEMALIYRLGIHNFWNALMKSSEWKSLVDFALVLMTMNTSFH